MPLCHYSFKFFQWKYAIFRKNLQGNSLAHNTQQKQSAPVNSIAMPVLSKYLRYPTPPPSLSLATDYVFTIYTESSDVVNDLSNGRTKW
jgi:hypothetical protein